MAITDPTTIDAVGISRSTGHVVLTIADHLGWDGQEGGEHLMALQDKLNAYANFITDGELLRRYPHAEGRRISIEVVGLHPPSEIGGKLMAQARAFFESLGVELLFRQLE